MKESIRQTPNFILQRASDLDDDDFAAAKEKFEKESTGFGLSSRISQETRAAIENSVSGSDGFMTLKDLNRYREEKSAHLLEAYDKLLQIPESVHVNCTTEVSAGLGALKSPSNKTGARTIGAWDSMNAYWKWVVMLCYTDIVERYGGVAIVDSGKVSLGAVNMLRSGQVKWLG